MSEGVVVADTQGKFLVFNPAAEGILGIGATDDPPEGWSARYGLFETDTVTVYPPDRLPLRRAIRGEEVREAEIFVRHAGKPEGLFICVNATPQRDGQGQVTGGVAVFRDVSERKGAEEKLLSQNQQLEKLACSERDAHHTLKQAQSQMLQTEKLASLGQLVAGVAHEINNPLAFVSNNVAVMQRDAHALRDLIQLYQQADELLKGHDPALYAQIHQLADRIDLPYTLESVDRLILRSRDGLKRIQHIVKDLRDFARLDESDLHEVDLNAGVESTINIIQGQAKKLQVGLKLDLATLPPVTCYPAKINQLVLNLVVNAIDACPPGGEVVVRTRPKNHGVELAVADNGSGIDPLIRERIFDPFFTTKPQGKGTGLGLSITYGIIKAHGGTIDLESTVGKGTCFRIWLPCKVVVGG
jgi:PAS domain S-box-containing protein